MNVRLKVAHIAVYGTATIKSSRQKKAGDRCSSVIQSSQFPGTQILTLKSEQSTPSPAPSELTLVLLLRFTLKAQTATTGG